MVRPSLLACDSRVLIWAAKKPAGVIPFVWAAGTTSTASEALTSFSTSNSPLMVESSQPAGTAIWKPSSVSWVRGRSQLANGARAVDVGVLPPVGVAVVGVLDCVTSGFDTLDVLDGPDEGRVVLGGLACWPEPPPPQALTARTRPAAASAAPSDRIPRRPCGGRVEMSGRPRPPAINPVHLCLLVAQEAVAKTNFEERGRPFASKSHLSSRSHEDVRTAGHSLTPVLPQPPT